MDNCDKKGREVGDVLSRSFSGITAGTAFCNLTLLPVCVCVLFLSNAFQHSLPVRGRREWCFGENIELEKKRQRGRNEGEGEILTPSGKERDGNAFPITINPLG